MTEVWQPEPQDVEWTRQVIDHLEDGQDWMEGEMCFRKTDDKVLTLLTRTERAEKAIERVKIVLGELDWTLVEEMAKIIPDDPQAAAEMMQKEAESWTCPVCKEHRVVNMDLEHAIWGVKGDTNYVDEEGGVESYERWIVTILCDCGEPVYLSPDDYYLIAGEVNFYTWNFVDEEGMAWAARVMATEQIVKCVDSDVLGQLNAFHLGTTFQGNAIPPHMRGTFCLMVTGAQEEEEE